MQKIKLPHFRTDDYTSVLIILTFASRTNAYVLYARLVNLFIIALHCLAAFK